MNSKKYKTTLVCFLNRIIQFQYGCTIERLKARDILIEKIKSELSKESDFDFYFYSKIKRYISMSNRELFYRSDILFLNWP